MYLRNAIGFLMPETGMEHKGAPEKPTPASR